MTAFKTEDIVSTLQVLNLIKYWKGQHIIFAPAEVIEEHKRTTTKVGHRVDPALLRWKPLYPGTALVPTLQKLLRTQQQEQQASEPTAATPEATLVEPVRPEAATPVETAAPTEMAAPTEVTLVGCKSAVVALADPTATAEVVQAPAPPQESPMDTDAKPAPKAAEAVVTQS
eukprot:TRINITY_DN2769_c0_g1_i3.p2 TRINITY_DN2769_c0_g1~~TRINITY_DN2769_c0_g1_i3.p2  ORF type:complete len:172 (-),score=50.36 TRINITY_DN2769_c0_g1_i3:51-566(-)